ncbi:MAG: cell division protein FtsZ [Chloroflexi bacterium]|nr:cell division protein FtsZ [Chloroflexota bacterium]
MASSADSPAPGYGARITVIGVGGGGGNTVNRISAARVQGITLVAINTDAQALQQSRASVKVPIGVTLTAGLGSGGNPEVGRQAAENSHDDIINAVRGADMVFITAGMGGGTGTGAAPVVARYAQEAGALTVGFVTRPFRFEGKEKQRIAAAGVEALRVHVDALVVIPNDRLLQLADARTTLQEAFAQADDVLRQGIQGITDIIITPGLINVDFADVRATLKQSGSALMAIGQGAGPRRAIDAAERAVQSPLLETSISGAKRVLLNVSGGSDMTIAEVNDAAEYIHSQAAPDAQIFFGAVLQDVTDGSIKISVIATDFPSDADALSAAAPAQERQSTPPPQRTGPAGPGLSSPRTVPPWLRRP